MLIRQPTDNTASWYKFFINANTDRFREILLLVEKHLKLNTTGSSNTAMGEEALKNNSTASNNTAIGR
jgi:hypothetical protein